MKILVIDRDEPAAEMITSSFSSDGYDVVVETVKNEGLDRVLGLFQTSFAWAA